MPQLIALVQYVLLPANDLKHGKHEFKVDRTRDGLEPLVFENVEQVKESYREGTLTPQLLKASVATDMNALLEPIRQEFASSQEWQDILLKAYPPKVPVVKAKKEKKPKKPTGEDVASGVEALNVNDSAEKEGEGEKAAAADTATA